MKSKSVSFIPYGRQQVDTDDIQAVVDVLKSDWLTCGPKVAEFEDAVACFSGVQYGIAVSSGTAALHCAMSALGVGPGDEVIVPCMTFAATANAVVYVGATPVFVDVEVDTLLIDVCKIEALITPKTKAIIAVDYAGQPCDYDALRELAGKYDLALVADSCHALGATYKGQSVASLVDLAIFSFHPVKHITTGEGGMVVTRNKEMAFHMRRFRSHGIDADHLKRQQEGTWYYEMVELGFNYRISDIQCALGISQLRKLPRWLERRRAIACMYNDFLQGVEGVQSLKVRMEVGHAYHLYPVQLSSSLSREKVFRAMREAGIGVNVHYLPVHLHPFYRQRFATAQGLCPVAEKAYENLLSLPMYQGLTDVDVQRVIHVLLEVLN